MSWMKVYYLLNLWNIEQVANCVLLTMDDNKILNAFSAEVSVHSNLLPD